MSWGDFERGYRQGWAEALIAFALLVVVLIMVVWLVRL